jgi:hypothetical protein
LTRGVAYEALGAREVLTGIRAGRILDDRNGEGHVSHGSSLRPEDRFYSLRCSEGYNGLVPLPNRDRPI